nr:MAG TPA: hypothetical protein [Bacteriophage sp.]
MSWAEEQPWFGLEDLITDHYVEYISIPAWRMADGNLIAIRDMETSHIKNCIKMIHRKNDVWRHQYLEYFEAELLKRKSSQKTLIVNGIHRLNMSEQEYKDYRNGVENIYTFSHTQ